jgi:hypothetical protein
MWMKKCDRKSLVSLAARQGFKPLANSKSPLKRTNINSDRTTSIRLVCSEDFSPYNQKILSPLQRTLALRQGFKPLTDCRNSELA